VRRPSPARLLAFAAPALLIAALLGGWEAACRALAVPPTSCRRRRRSERRSRPTQGALLASAWITLSTALAALAIAAAVAWPLAFAASLSPTAERALQPLAVTLQVTPVVAIAPLAVIWAGLDHPGRAIVGLAALVAFFPLFSGALTGLKSADPDQAGRLQRLARLRLPAAVPYLLEGLKVASGLAVIGAVVAEFVAGSGGSQGLAWRILEAGNRQRTPQMFAALLALSLLGAALYAAARALEAAALRRWRGR